MHATFLYSSAVPSFGATEPVIAVRIAQTWLAAGCVAVLCLPALRERSEWLGWLPLWLVVVPAAQLALLRWRFLLSASRKAFGRLRHRRPRARTRRRQACRPWTQNANQRPKCLPAAMIAQ